MSAYAWSVNSALPMDQAVEATTAALAAQGFGILTRIDVHETLKKKIGADFRPYVILGACNPPLAHQALQAEASIGILLPCNVVVEQQGEGSRIWITDPGALFSLVGRDDVRPLADEVSRRLLLVKAALEGAAPVGAV